MQLGQCGSNTLPELWQEGRLLLCTTIRGLADDDDAWRCPRALLLDDIFVLVCTAATYIAEHKCFFYINLDFFAFTDRVLCMVHHLSRL